MTRVRVLTLSLLTFALIPGLSLLGCSPETGGGTNVERTGGTGGGGSGGSGGRGGSGAGTGGSSSTGGSGGSSSGTGGSGGSTGGNGGSTGGSSGSGGTGGSGGSTGGSGGSGGSTGGIGGSGGGGGSSTDAKVTVDAPTGPDGAAGEAGGSSVLTRGEPVASKPWIRLCPKAWDKTQCCTMLCDCLPELCSDSPGDKARFGNCMSMCMGLSVARAQCQVYHCYESKNPGATKDHVSHCGHASGRVGGGSCTIIDQQK